MRILKLNIYNPNFLGQRQDRKTVAQLKNDNAYDLNVPNQRRISKAIENLSNIPGEDNINFLLDTADQLQYGTNIDLGKKSYNDWKTKLNNAAKNSLGKSDLSVQEKLKSKLEQSITKKPLTKIEKDILTAKQSLLEKVDFKSLEQISNSNIKNLKRNLDYFIISSEVPTTQKLYILKRLNYFMSPEYKINPQLEDKKTQALAEMVNDIVVDTPESKIPNIKAINQRAFGICASISICRKALAYEDKPNYIDMIMSELDASDYMQVYDITKLGTNKKIPILKNDVDFDYAIQKGLRIVDASAMYWMNVADTAGSTNEIIGSYSPFDKINFDTFESTHITADLENELVNKQDYYRVLLKTKSKLATCKKYAVKKQISTKEKLEAERRNIQYLSKCTTAIHNILKEISPESSEKDIKNIISDILKLEVSDSQKAAAVKDYKQNFVYIPNEEPSAKAEKLQAFLSIALPQGKNSQMLKEKAADLLELTSEIHSLNGNSTSSYAGLNIYRAQMLYNAAAAYRTQNVFRLDVPEFKRSMMKDLNIPDNESRLLENMDFLIKKLKKNTLNPEIQKQLAVNFITDNDNEALLESLTENRKTVQYITTELLDDLYASCLSVDRKQALANNLNATKNMVEADSNPHSQLIIELAANLNVKENKKSVIQALDNYIELLKSPQCSDEQYISIFNRLGNKSQMEDFKNTFERLGQCLFTEKIENIIKGFNAKNGISPDAPIEQTHEIYKNIANNFNNISSLLSSYHAALNIKDSSNNVLNTTDSKEIILKYLENMGEILSVSELETLRNKFLKIDKAKSYDENGTVRYKDLPSELTNLTPYEKRILEKIDYNINGWYSITTRRLGNIYQELKEPLSELNRDIGVKIGQSWVNNELSEGLSSAQEAKIIQHMTGRPYYIEYDGRVAMNKIKNSPYSGISSTSVTTNAPGMHAQYIVDVKPVEVKTKDGKTTTKDAIFHDNTWGAKEHDNVWIDENGFTRTDYASDIGGMFGYITDDKYRNGNIAENLLDKYGEVQASKVNSKIYKRLVKDYDGYRFPMFADVILPGKYPNAMQYVEMLREQTLVPPYMYLKDLEDYAKTMTTDELKAKLKMVDTIGAGSNKKYNDLLDRIKGSDNIIKGIETREAYDRLPQNDNLKITMEKLALIKSYSTIPDMKLFNKECTVEDLKLLKSKIHQEARKNFDYTFAKNIDVAKFGAENSRKQLTDILTKFAQENNIKFNDRQMISIVNSMKRIDTKKFDGSLNKTIDLMCENFEAALIKNTPAFENKEEKISILANSIRNILETNMGFTLADLNGSSFGTGKTGNIVKWIDDVFDPATDEEFVQIFNNLRNMTTKEFISRYQDKITDEALGIKKVTGFDIITQLRAENDKTHKSLFNMICEEEYIKGAKLSKTTPSYDYRKFERKLNGYNYVKNKRAFDDIYLDYYFSLMMLSRGREYDKFKKEAFDKYNLFPAYPIVNYENPEGYQNEIENLYTEISSDINVITQYKNQDKAFKILKSLLTQLSKLNPDSSLTKRQYTSITNQLNEFSKINEGDETLKNILTSIQDIISSESMSVSEYKKLIENTYRELSPYEKTIDGRSLDVAVKSVLESINLRKKFFVRNLIDPKYESKAMEILNKWIAAKSKVSTDNSDNAIELEQDADKIFAQFTKLFEQHRLLKNPQNILEEYLLMNTKDARPKDSYLSGDKAVNAMKEFEANKAARKTILSNLLFNANMLEIQYTLMKCAKSGTMNAVGEAFRNSELALKNGTSVPMDSDKALNIILGPMLYDSDLYTARMFIEQLGLSEKVIELVTKDFSFQSSYKLIKRIHSILASVSKQSKIVQEEFEKLGNIDHDPDAIEKIRNAQAKILKRTKNTNFRLSLKVFNQAIENTITQIQEHPEHSKTAILFGNMNIAISAAQALVEREVEDRNSALMLQQTLHDLVANLKLPENSPFEDLRQKYLDEFSKVEEFRESMTRHYDGLGVTA